ncbi:MAG: sugar phosphate nucleotidyltransferase [Patescibacteria group bacterium]|nr:sugar phosphate nucleotidyltransferase [Patescibacteria group bacterium]
MDNLYAVIFAGGVGSRLWPVSRTSQPKQLKPFLGDDDTLLKRTWKRISKLLPPERIYVSTVVGLGDEISGQLPELVADNLILEPELRNTTAAIGLATTVINQKDSKAMIINLWADHHYRDEVGFIAAVKKCYKFLKVQPPIIIGVGMPIEFPYSGYGYLEVDPQEVTKDIYRVCSFKEKPSLEQARNYMDAGNYYWNAALFMWPAKHMLELYKELVPEMYRGLQEIELAWPTKKRKQILDRVYPEFTKIAVDYAIMEKSPEMYLVDAGDLGWKDVGSWQSIHDILKKDTNGSISVKGKGVVTNSKDILIFNEDEDKLVTVVGLEDVAVVNTKDAILVVKKSRDQEVKDLVLELEKSHFTGYL